MPNIELQTEESRLEEVIAEYHSLTNAADAIAFLECNHLTSEREICRDFQMYVKRRDYSLDQKGYEEFVMKRVLPMYAAVFEEMERKPYQTMDEASSAVQRNSRAVIMKALSNVVHDDKLLRMKSY